MLQTNASLKKHNTWRIESRAKILFTPNNLNELKDFLKKNNQPILFLGLGSNILFNEIGFDGVVILTKNINEIKINESNIIAQCGATLAKVARITQQKKLHNLEFFAGIPGTIGGALAMNAGAFGFETWNNISKVQTIDSKGEIHIRDKEDFLISYRSITAKYKNEYFISAFFELNKNKNNQDIRMLLEKRNQTQPIGLASCGSVFKNPKNTYAAKIIEDLGLKGFCINDACISDKHANFIINKNNATSQDIKKLINHIQTIAKKELNINLETEVIIL
ncbi:UDP-N-acetylenolpyruvoylglucosamine reductase [hydrothermal vent metagenome]|uniref:UDP-N-acetylmuramate dehydrogenase n=1 Tax=hydrothermal vent metagenome TaxID=652676 RepID=A0A1W1BQ61_9ZZZZ